jgi:hypothetical protein
MHAKCVHGFWYIDNVVSLEVEKYFARGLKTLIEEER